MSTHQHDPSAEFVSLLTKHQPELWSYIITLMPGDPDTSDVLQKTNLLLWTKQSDFTLGTNFRAWAFSVARFEVMAHLKKQKRMGIVLLDDELLEKIAEEAPDALTQSDVRLGALERCLNQLRAQDRELLDHRYRTNAGLEEFASRVGRSVSALSVTLHRLRSALRKCIQDRMINEGGMP